MRRTVKLQVLMAGMYRIPKGKKVEFSYDRGYGLYIASSDRKAFGLAKSMRRRQRYLLKKLGTSFSGAVVESVPEERKLVVKVKL